MLLAVLFNYIILRSRNKYFHYCFSWHSINLLKNKEPTEICFQTFAINDLLEIVKRNKYGVHAEVELFQLRSVTINSYNCFQYSRWCYRGSNVIHRWRIRPNKVQIQPGLLYGSCWWTGQSWNSHTGCQGDISVITAKSFCHLTHQSLLKFSVKVSQPFLILRFVLAQSLLDINRNDINCV